LFEHLHIVTGDNDAAAKNICQLIDIYMCVKTVSGHQEEYERVTENYKNIALSDVEKCMLRKSS